MAENAAHVTSSLQTRPSIFEVIAQESLSELLYPSFKIIVQFLGSGNPQKYQWLSKWNEEIFLGVNGILQLYYLNNKDGSFSESFYGLRRVSGSGSELPLKAKIWSLVCLVMLPYLLRKSEQFVIKIQNPKIDTCHRAARAGWQALSLLQYLLYLTAKSNTHSPLLRIANLSLQYCPEVPELSYSWRDLFNVRQPRESLRLIGHSMSQGLQLAAFFLQCLQWWHSDEVSHTPLTSAIPPPPATSTMGTFQRNTTGEDSSSTVCPICKETCKIETALLTSGYVFCFRCIRDFINTHQKCPVTNLPTSLDELIRIYASK